MAKQPRRPNKLPEFDADEDEKLAADRQLAPSSWPGNDYVLGAALMLAGVIVLIAIAIATGLVKP